MSKLNLLTYPAVAILSLVAAGAAFAGDITPDDSATQMFTTTKTRAQVQAELFAARADGSIKVWSTSHNPLALAKSDKTRDQVMAELRDAERDADYAVTWYGEDSGSFALARTLPSRVAGPVYAAVTTKTAQ
ncbi:MAG: DUF4148 domain-containing protein [Rubrivivax sp.]